MFLLGVLSAAGASGAAGAGYFFALAESASKLRGAAHDGNDLWVTGTVNPSGTNLGFIGKFNSDFSIQKQTTTGSQFEAIEKQGSLLAAAGLNPIYAGFTSAGAFSYQKNYSTLDFGYPNFNVRNTLAVDSGSNGIGMAQGINFSPFSGACVIYKFDTAGDLVWKQIAKKSSILSAGSLATDSSDNVYLTTGEGLLKLDSSGAKQWDVIFTTVALLQAVTTVDTDVYVSTPTVTPRGLYLAKLNTSGSLLWQKLLADSTVRVFNQENKLTKDSEGNVIAAGLRVSNLNVNVGMDIAKFDSSGNLLWQRFIEPDAGVTTGIGGLTVDPNDDIVISGSLTVSGTERAAIFKIPKDGSLTGIYTVGGVEFTYDAGTASLTTPTETISASGISVASSSLTVATTTFTLADASLSTERVSL